MVTQSRAAVLPLNAINFMTAQSGSKVRTDSAVICQFNDSAVSLIGGLGCRLHARAELPAFTVLTTLESLRYEFERDRRPG